MVSIKVILGSTRPGRFGIQPAEWIMKLSEQYGEQATFELVDLQEINLPFLDTPVPPSMSPTYQNDHQAAWGKIIDEADGFVIVTAEYNHGIPAALKNAIDFLAKEWADKPVAFVGYGADAGGIRAMEQLRQVGSWLKMHDINKFVSFPNYFMNLDEQGAYKFSDDEAERAHSMLKDLLFWAEELKASRAKLNT